MVLYCSLRHRDAQVLLVTIVLVQEQHSHSHAYQRSFLILHFVFCLLHYSMSNLHTIYHRISSKFQSRSSASGNTLGNGLARESPALDNAKMIFQLASNLGSGALNVPGLQASGLIGVQIITAIQVSIIVYFSFSVSF